VDRKEIERMRTVSPPTNPSLWIINSG